MINRPSASNCPSLLWSSRMYTLPHSAEKILHLRSSGSRWQERPASIPGLQLPVHYQGQAIYLHHANETRWGYLSFLIQVGTKFSLTCPISQGELMDPTISKLWESPSTPIAGSAEFTSRIGCTVKRNFPQSSNFSSPFKSSNERHNALSCKCSSSSLITPK